MSKEIAKVWEFNSSSSTKVYETLQYTDGTTSCNCPGWTRRVAADGSRSCKHTRMIDMGTADRECSAHHDYTQTGMKKKMPAKLSAPRTKAGQEEIGGRRIMWRATQQNKNKV